MWLRERMPKTKIYARPRSAPSPFPSTREDQGSSIKAIRPGPYCSTAIRITDTLPLPLLPTLRSLRSRVGVCVLGTENREPGRALFILEGAACVALRVPCVEHCLCVRACACACAFVWVCVGVALCSSSRGRAESFVRSWAELERSQFARASRESG